MFGKAKWMQTLAYIKVLEMGLTYLGQNIILMLLTFINLRGIPMMLF